MRLHEGLMKFFKIRKTRTLNKVNIIYKFYHKKKKQ